MASIDTYQLAVMGQNLSNTYTFSTNGVLINVRIIDLEPELVEIGGGGIIEETPRYVSKKKVVVSVNINGKDYKEELIVLDRPNLRASDVKVDVKSDDRPNIEIKIL